MKLIYVLLALAWPISLYLAYSIGCAQASFVWKTATTLLHESWKDVYDRQNAQMRKFMVLMLGFDPFDKPEAPEEIKKPSLSLVKSDDLSKK